MTTREILEEARTRLEEAGFTKRGWTVEAVIRSDIDSDDDDTCDIHPLEDTCKEVEPGQFMDMYVYRWSGTNPPGLVANVTYQVGNPTFQSIVVGA